jgi:hypothetical protein
MNSFAYDLVRQLTNLDSVLSATVILAPANARELANLMLERHHLSGVKVMFSKNMDKRPTKREVLQHFEKYASGSRGNIGVAMLRWISSIEKYDQETVFVKEFKEDKLPGILPVSWAILLTHLVLHEKLHIKNMIAIFHLQDKSKVHSVVKELLYTKLIKESSKNTYKIEPVVLKSVIEQLKNQNYLKNFE